MYESLCLSLLSALSSFLFDNHNTTMTQTIHIEGAPSWYGKSSNNSYITSFGYSKGDLNYLDLSKKDCKRNLEDSLSQLITISTTKSFQKHDTIYYNDFLETYKKNQDLNSFILTNIHYEEIYHKKDSQETFSKCTIPKVLFLEYEKIKINEIKKSYSKFKLDKNIEILDEESKKL
ncbi:hypothetical protein [Arcobacter sp.]|uniref:hypothetical protein n=1 Tax=Arcobacter sp. TaxID=1872629 RepID=UPI003D0E6E7F